MRSKHVDVAWFGGFSYVLAAELAGAQAFAVPVPAKTGISAYSSCIFVRADSPYKDLGDLKGKTFALVDPSSTSGNMFPRALLKMHGIEEAEKYFSRVIYSGSHNASLLALKNAKIDAVGSNPEISLNNMIRNNQIGADELRKVLCSDPIPNSPFAIRSDLPGQQAEKIKAAFYQIKDLTFAEYGKLEEFKKAQDSDYDIIRDVAKLMDLDLKK